MGDLVAWGRLSQALFGSLPVPEPAKMLGLSGGLEAMRWHIKAIRELIHSADLALPGPSAAVAPQMEAVAGSPEIGALTQSLAGSVLTEGVDKSE